MSLKHSTKHSTTTITQLNCLTKSIAPRPTSILQLQDVRKTSRFTPRGDASNIKCQEVTEATGRLPRRQTGRHANGQSVGGVLCDSSFVVVAGVRIEFVPPPSVSPIPKLGHRSHCGGNDGGDTVRRAETRTFYIQLYSPSYGSK